ncbi:MAG TPA: response regulator [Candidatus Acidoferrales bacterium]|jgi:PAS domain S-box-containing protein|nr:response regulator [Candidatus Acidoferrales bacterium]
MNSSGAVLVGSYNYGLVALSVLIAVAASYAALDLAGRVTAARGRLRAVWLGGGAIAMGTGIWSMHYVGMLAFRLPVRVEYDWPTVLVSMVAAILASAIALFVVSRERMGPLPVAAGSAFMGAGIAGMHYIGMAAMRMAAMCSYSAPIVGISIAIAIVISFVALQRAFHFRRETTSGGWRKALSAIVMGAAIPAMHYTGMAAAHYTAMPENHDDYSHAMSISTVGTVGIVIVTFLMLGLAVVTVLVDRRFSDQAMKVEANERRLRQILETSFDAFVEMDSAGKITDWNAQAEKTFGWSRSEMIGKLLSETIVAARDRESYVQNAQGLLGSGGFGVNRRFEVRALCRGGREIPAETTISTVNSGDSPHLALFVRDLTQRERAEEKFKVLLESSSEAVILINREGRIAIVNSHAEIRFGYTRAEMLDQKVEMLLPERFRAKHTGYRADFFADSKARPMGAGRELYGVRKDGSEFPVDISLTPLETDEGIMISAVIVDISERKRFEKEILAAKETAENASAAKSVFLATMSHEIRTPMNGILGMTELVMETELTTEQREHLGLVRLSAESLLAIINDVLDFSKIEAGKFEIEAIPFGLRDSLGETMQSLSIRTHQKGLELIYDVDPEVPDAVIGDPGRVRQVLVNLIGNAIKFTERGEVFVQVREEAQEDNHTRLHFTIKDTGVGIPKDKQGKIFEAFSQADGSMARKYGGTGLGLTICMQLVKLMGGNLWVESEEGQGSEFHFTVQLALQEPSAHAEPLEAQQLRGLHVLIVDDNLTNRKVLAGMLTRCGMKPTLIDGGRAALQALLVARDAGSRFPLVLLDGQMPEMDGFTLAERIKRDVGLVGSTIMMLTSSSHLGDAARCREAGISAYLVKPIRQSELLQAVCSALNPTERVKAPLITRHTLREERNRARVLLAEDNAVNQTLAIRLLERRGYSVTVTTNGKEAVTAWENSHFDAVLMDVQMPEMDGFEATTIIRRKEQGTGRRVPIIAMTAHALKGDEQRCLAAGMDGYISKPIRTAEMFGTIERVLAQSNGGRAPESVEVRERPLHSA